MLKLEQIHLSKSDRIFFKELISNVHRILYLIHPIYICALFVQANSEGQHVWGSLDDDTLGITYVYNEHSSKRKCVPNGLLVVCSKH